MAAHRDDDNDQVRVALFQVDPGWYEAYWYGPDQKPAKRRRGDMIQWLSAKLTRVRQALRTGETEPLPSTLAAARPFRK